jgi:hypothetical protein
MPGRNLAPPLLDDANAAFIQGGVSINASSRTVENIPVMSRCVGCRISTDRRIITLFFHRPGAENLLAGIRVSQQIAAVFSRPSTHQTIQLKGSDAVAVQVQKRDNPAGGEVL